MRSTTEISNPFSYCGSLLRYARRQTCTVSVGDLKMGSAYPIRLQSMTTTDTLDTKATVAQAIRMIEAGCELVRITAPSINDARNLENIRKELHALGYKTPLVADIHFTPNAAETAARLVEKVRVNPGNYADKKKFEHIEYTDAAYEEELERIRDKFVPLVKICKEYGTAMRIGTNHGSLSDRILSRYGDTPLGMVESALEFLRICDDEGYHNIVLSMKASNPQVMVQAYRLLVNRIDAMGWNYPLHLGVTEAGEGEDGRIKSAAGIGALLEDGLGDTIRVSLTEDPELEIPVAKMLADRYTGREKHTPVQFPPIAGKPAEQPEGTVFNPFSYNRRHSHETANLGGHNVPRVISDLSHINPLTEFELQQAGHIYDAALDKWHMTDQGADYIYCGNKLPSFMLPNGSRAILDYSAWQQAGREHTFPLLGKEDIKNASALSETVNFLALETSDISREILGSIAGRPFVLVLDTHNLQGMAEQRQAFLALQSAGISLPVIIRRHYPAASDEEVTLYAATDTGTLLLDGWGDGVWIKAPQVNPARLNSIAFGILQATRTRISKTEYISCPSCGRTLFDLQETTARIRKQTDHLKGIKIGIMGCIVNGPGEMADADYGYVGTGPGKITLYRGKEVVKRNVNEENAVSELIGLIREDGNWIEKNNN